MYYINNSAHRIKINQDAINKIFNLFHSTTLNIGAMETKIELTQIHNEKEFFVIIIMPSHRKDTCWKNP